MIPIRQQPSAYQGNFSCNYITIDLYHLNTTPTSEENGGRKYTFHNKVTAIFAEI